MTPTAVYILKCECEAWYIGLSVNPYRRLIKHLEGEGSLFTTHYKPLRIAYVKWYPSRNQAMHMEEVWTCLLRDQALKVGGGLRTGVSMSGRGRWREFESIGILWAMEQTLPKKFHITSANRLEKTAVVV